MNLSRVLLGMASVAIITATAGAFPIYPEVEGNDTRATATVPPACLNPGDGVSGNSVASTGVGVDYFRLNICADAPAIYEWRLSLASSTAGHSSTLRSLNQTAVAQAPWLPGMAIGTPGATDGSAQAHVLAGTDRVQKWYGFGKGEFQYYRVTGGAATTADYTATLSRTTITPVDLGSYAPGNIEIRTLGQGHTTDTDLWIYDANLDPIVGYGNDDEATAAVSGCVGATGVTLQSCLIRSYGPGTYYMALSNFALTNNQPSPSDDDFRTGALLESPGAILNSSSTLNVNVTFRVTDANGSTQFPTTRAEAHQVVWAKFTVTPEPSTLTLLALGALGLIRRRK